MTGKKKQDMMALLSKAERAEMESTIRAQYAQDLVLGDTNAKEHPQLYKRHLRESIASEMILARKDGTVVTYDSGSRRALLGNLEVEDLVTNAPDATGHYVAHHDLTTIRQNHRIGGPGMVMAQDNGNIRSSTNPVTVNCGVAVAIEAMVDKALRNGKLDPQEASQLSREINAPHPLRRDGPSCGKGGKI